MLVLEQVERLIEPSLQDMGYTLVRVRFRGGQRATLQIMAEKADDTAMEVADCADISRVVSALLDVEDPIKGSYQLEVSSPGIDRPLVRAEDFERYAGFEAKVETTTPIDGRRRFRGQLLGMAGNCVRLKPKGGEADRVAVLPFDDIADAKLVLTDALIKANRSKR